MAQSSITLSLRSLARQPLHTSINLIGLTIGLAASILIFLYSWNELTYNASHEKRDRIHLVIKERHLPSGVQELWDTWVPLRNVLVEDYPEVVNAARTFTRTMPLTLEGQAQPVELAYADPSLLEIFSFPLAEGAPVRMLEDPKQAVLTHDLARRLFGEASPVGESILLGDEDEPFLVAGVLEPLPHNSSINFELLLPFQAAIDPRDEEMAANWDRAFLMTFVELAPGASARALEQKLPDTVEKIFGTEGPNGRGSLFFRLVALPDLHDWLTGNRMMARVLLALSLVILLIAAMNFTNLSTAGALRRVREVGVRKVLGAGRAGLAIRFLLESLMLALLALVLAVVLVEVLIPVMNTAYSLDLRLDLAGQPLVLLRLALFGVAVGLLAGLYPALYLSRFSPTRTLRGDMGRLFSGRRFRQMLVGLQFAFSITLIVGTAVIWQQIHYMKHAELHLEAESVLALPYDLRNMGEPQEAFARLETARTEIERLPAVRGSALSSGVPGSFVRTNVFVEPEGWESDVPLRMAAAAMDQHWFELYGVPLLAGRYFDGELASESERSLILNRTAVKQMGLTPEEALGTRVNAAGPREVVGVVEDFHFESLTNEVRPVVMIHRGLQSGFNSYLSVKLLPSGDTRASLEQIEAQWQKVVGQGGSDWFFVNERLQEGYAATERSASLASLFAALGIFIAALGLVGLVSAAVTSRTKEIGVRKVLGANMAQVIRAIGSPYLLPVVAASLAAWPLAWLLLRSWLENYPYRVSPSPWLFLAGTLAGLLVAAGTVALTAWQPARENPVRALRYE